MKTTRDLLLVSAMVAVLSLPATALVIHNPWISNDRVADLHNINTMAATYVNAYTPDGVVPPASDQDKAINIYNNQKRRLYHWADEPPSVGGNVIGDPTYNHNVFGWALCGRHGAMGMTISRYAGFSDTRNVGVTGHNIYEVYYDGGWHLFDTMTTMYVFTKTTPPHVACLAEISADHSIMLNAVADGRACPGYLLCGDTADWYVGAADHWSDMGHTVQQTIWNGNMDLRSGQTYERTWEAWQNQCPTPRTNADSDPGLDPPYHHESQHDWKDYVNYPYWEPYGVVIPYVHSSKTTYRRWSNGTDTITPDFRSGAYQDLLEPTSHDIASYYTDGLTPDLHTATVGTTAEAIIKISVPYYLTDASFSGDFVKTNSGDVCNVQFSTNGTTWTTVWTASTLGTTTVTNQSLRSNIFAKWQTWYIKVQLKSSAAVTDAGVSNFSVVTTFEHNKGAMAYLDKGVNHLTITCDNPEDLGSNWRMKVTYKWKENNGAGWTIDKTYVRHIDTSPADITVTTGGAKVPRTESIQLQLVPTPAPDSTAPSSVTDLQGSGTPGRTSVPLTWTAPGNDGTVGEAIGYDLRYSTSTIDAGNFGSVTQVANVPVPRPAGATESFTVTGLTPSTMYYFAIKAFDEDGNYGAISNVATVTTRDADPLAPEAVTDLAVATSATLGNYTLTWTAPADNGNGYVATYDLRYATSPITEETFASATAVAGLASPKSPGSGEAFVATQLATGTTLYFAIKGADDSGNWSGLSNVPTAREVFGKVTFQNGLNGYSGAQDSYMSAAATTTTYDGLEYLQLCGFSDSTWTNQRRPILKFDMTSLPTAAVITKATLYVYSYSNELHDETGGAYGAYHVYHPWSAPSVCWNKPWSDHGGGDTDSTPDTETAKQTTTNVWYAFDLTDRVQQYIASPGDNNGWVIKCTNPGLHNQDWLYACEATADISLRPKLIVTDLKTGDVNGDDLVNVGDLQALAIAWASTCATAPPGSNWDSCADFNNDRYVNVGDLQILIANWDSQSD